MFFCEFASAAMAPGRMPAGGGGTAGFLAGLLSLCGRGPWAVTPVALLIFIISLAFKAHCDALVSQLLPIFSIVASGVPKTS